MPISILDGELAAADEAASLRLGSTIARQTHARVFISLINFGRKKSGPRGLGVSQGRGGGAHYEIPSG